MNQNMTFRTKVHFRVGGKGRKQLEQGETPPVLVPAGRVPWISKLMALAIRMDGLVRKGEIVDQAELARLGHVSRARMTQIMNLLYLAPDIQEELLFLPAIVRGKDPIQERQMRPIVAALDWQKQRRMWKDHKSTRASGLPKP